MQKYVCFVGLLVLLTNCQNDLQPVVSEPTSGHPNARQADEGSLVIVTFQGQDIPVLKLNGQYYLSDDQLIPNELVTAEKPYSEPKAFGISTYRTYQASTWPNNVVKYRFSGANISTIGATVSEAIKVWNSLDTKIKFAVYNDANNLTPAPSGGIVIFSCDNMNTSNSTSGLGYQPTSNVKVSLMKNVEVSTVLHEMMHVIGIAHEHVRGIRDAYVSIDEAVGAKRLGSSLFKTQIGNRKDLTIYADKVVDTYPFDFNSIMIYELPDIIKSKIAGKSIKQSTTLTAKDLNLINKIANYNALPRVILRKSVDSISLD